MSVVVITGASAGVGRACAREFARRGYDVGLLARDVDRLEAAATEVREAGRRALAVPTDVSDANAVEAAAARVEAELGPIDVWVNNAMVSVLGPVLSLGADEFRRVTEVTYLGVVHGTLSALRRMSARDRGTIVQVGSALAYRSIPLQAPYCAAKAAGRGFTDSVRAELRHQRSHVRLTQVNLPAINTPQFLWLRSRMPRAAQPVPPIYEPEIAARAIAWAAEHQRRELDVGWPTVLARLGQGIAPGLMDRYVAGSAWKGQQTDDPEATDRPDNLEESVRARVGARGTFSDQAGDTSVQLWAATHRGLVAAGALGVSGLVTIAGLLRRGASTRRWPRRRGGPAA
jgi:NADP-dependent 3-hydroxy acid dehydrogenase YdfG